MKRMIFAASLLSAALPVFAQSHSFHVTGIQDHIRTKDEQSFSTALHTRRYTGTVDGVTVVAEEAITAFSHASRITPGRDYEVTKFKAVPGGTLHVRQDPDKKGHQEDAWLTVVSVSE